MIYHITKENSTDSLNVLFQAFQRTNYNEECFSCSDIRMRINAENALGRIFTRLHKENQIDIGDFQRQDGFNASLLPEGFDMKFNLGPIEYGLPKGCPYLEEGMEPAEFKDRFYEVSSPINARFAYRAWDSAYEAISYLSQHSPLYKKARRKLEEILQNRKLDSVRVLADLGAGDDYDSSQIILAAGECTLIVQDGGFYEDIIVLEDNKIKEIVEYGKIGGRIDLNHSSAAFSLGRLKKGIDESDEHFQGFEREIERFKESQNGIAANQEMR